ncbi:MAG: VanZ family protein [Deltaproteobacteria bacterium]|nr:VanZ family protein [Deltaproteobacteria bacterium]
MKYPTPDVLQRNRPQLTTLVVAVILVAVLWPGPIDWPNHLRWRIQGAGLRFDDVAQALSEGPIVSSTGEMTLEIWLVPGFRRSKGNQEIVSFYDEQQRRPLLLGQFNRGFILRGREDNPVGTPPLDSYIRIRDVGLVSDHDLRHLALTVSGEGTRLHVNGRATSLVLPKTIAEEGVDFGGHLMLGNSYSGWGAWFGGMLAVAIYDRVLGPDELRAHTLDRARGGEALLRDSSLLALYRFEEGKGDRTRSAVARGPDLTFPERMTRPTQPKYLNMYKYYPAKDGWLSRDVVLNVLGFMPLGFLISWKRRARVIAIAFAVGFALSLSIELAQAFIPGRASSMNDLMSNSVGALLGALLTRFGRSR